MINWNDAEPAVGLCAVHGTSCDGSQLRLHPEAGILCLEAWFAVRRCACGSGLPVILKKMRGIEIGKCRNCNVENELYEREKMKSKIKLSKDRVYEVLKAQGRTRAWLLEKLGVTPQALYYRFRNNWGLGDALLVAQTLGVAIDDLTPEND